ncbi:MAG: FHA domain-containing protein [Fibrobacter sp.]|jgi:pSer/pThr/pTyr-binding forkhead associated (FHA) protein|nr:FHA domain-containing protein [Fibrobacter sp.]
MLKFVVFYNGEPLKTYELDEPVVSIGRLPENTISIANMGISRRHTKIEEDADHKYVLSDLNSLNGTYVNGKRVKRITLNSGDKITIGKYTILFEQINLDQESHIGFQEMQPAPSAYSQPIAQSEQIVDEKDVKTEKEESSAVLIETNKHVVYKLDKPFLSVGNGEDDDIFVSGFMIGEGQVSIEKQTEGFYIHANKLMGKIKVNGKSIRNHLLQHKDRIEIGSSTFRFMENG